MGYRVSVVNPTGFPLSGEPDDRGRVTYRPRVGGRRVRTYVPESIAGDLRDEHNQVVQRRQKRALGLSGSAAAKKKVTKKKVTKKKVTKKSTSSQNKPSATGNKKTYRIAINQPKKNWPSVDGIAVGEHFGVHKQEDGLFALTHLPTGLSLATTRTRKRLVEIGETLEHHLKKTAGQRFPKRLVAAIHKVPLLGSWIRAFAGNQTRLSYVDFRPSK